jgi:hypothetical protein
MAVSIGAVLERQAADLWAVSGNGGNLTDFVAGA